METLAGYILDTGLDVQFWSWVVVVSVIFGALFHVALNVVRAIEPAKNTRLFIAEMLDLVPGEIVRERRDHKERAAHADKENEKLRERLKVAFRRVDEEESRAETARLTAKNARLAEVRAQTELQNQRIEVASLEQTVDWLTEKNARLEGVQ